MRNDGFIDYYEVLQVNPRAEAATINRIYRHLAKRFHPVIAQPVFDGAIGIGKVGEFQVTLKVGFRLDDASAA